MVKRFFIRLMTIFVVALMVVPVASLLLKLVPYFVAALVLFIPIWGVLRERREKKNLSQISGVRNWLKFFRGILFKRRNIKTYLVLLTVIVLLHEEIMMTALQTAVFCAISMIIFMFAWKELRKLAIKKGYHMISLREAIKKSL